MTIQQITTISIVFSACGFVLLTVVLDMLIGCDHIMAGRGRLRLNILIGRALKRAHYNGNCPELAKLPAPPCLGVDPDFVPSA